MALRRNKSAGASINIGSAKEGINDGRKISQRQRGRRPVLDLVSSRAWICRGSTRVWAVAPCPLLACCEDVVQTSRSPETPDMMSTHACSRHRPNTVRGFDMVAVISHRASTRASIHTGRMTLERINRRIRDRTKKKEINL